MKIFVRSFALVLIATGAVPSLNAANSSSTVSSVDRISSPPVPMCPPGVPDGCGIGTFGK